MSQHYVLATAVDESDLTEWELVLALCPSVRFTGTGPVTSLCRDGEWVGGVCTNLRAVGLPVPSPESDHPPRLVTVVGSRSELRHALAGAHAEGLPVAIMAFHPDRRSSAA